jgi:hypothetical protein
MNRWMFSKPDENGWIFKWMIDTYMEGFDYVTNYVFADTLSSRSLAENLKKGHNYVAFKTLGDAKGFNFFATGAEGTPLGIMGDSLMISRVKTINAVAPLPGQFRLIHNGNTLKISEVDSYEFTYTDPLEKGAYRVEIHVKIGGKYIPWIYSNPLYLY